MPRSELVHLASKLTVPASLPLLVDPRITEVANRTDKAPDDQYRPAVCARAHLFWEIFLGSGDFGQGTVSSSFLQITLYSPQPDLLSFAKMYTNKSRPRPCLALLFLDRVPSSFGIFGIVVLILLSTPSVAQLIPYSRALPVHSNASLSSNALKTYVIYSFVEGPSPDSENERIRLHLGMILGSTDAEEYGGDYTGVEFWRVRMNDVQRAAFLIAIPRVGVKSSKEKFRATTAADDDKRLKFMRTSNFSITTVTSLISAVRIWHILTNPFPKQSMIPIQDSLWVPVQSTNETLRWT